MVRFHDQSPKKELYIMILEDQIDDWAKRIALGNNGGDWAEHYTEEQKEYWRDLVSALISAIKEEIDRDSPIWDE